ncbi:MarR family winged helix-turn-helix transcriptional regulator [Paenibacillus qinlingensis]|uniref:MarR family winged helix-turn-helix transcriptional regulator n=1 Tax=Paenibacillus qinlingensis TaxID=1837343 RepID=UPI00156595A1|nr:MarR family transcriptional regulator [Paenibacillus qinlingensis]NQX61687.1 MarR family transcriptional regulator [Paenibacillus qinlingensis]
MDDQQQQRTLEIIHSAREVKQAFHQVMSKAYQHLNITPIQSFVLRKLSEKPGITLSELAEYIQLGKSTTSGIIDRMVRDQLVSREQSSTDRRSVILKLLDKGELLLQRVRENQVERMSPLLQMSDDEIDSLLRIHQKIVRILNQELEEDSTYE